MSCLIRYRYGTRLELQPDLLPFLRRILGQVTNAEQLAHHVRQAGDGLGWGIHAESTWARLIQELLERNRADNRQEREKCDLAVLSVLRDIVEAEPGLAMWSRASAALVDNIDRLSGWEFSPYHRWQAMEPVEREADGRYYVETRQGRVEIIGRRTYDEERFDHVASSMTGKYGSIHSVLRVVALIHICDELQSGEKPPESLELVLPEDAQHTWFSAWSWQVRTPLLPRLVGWKPRNFLCDADWLGNDLLARFAAGQTSPGRDSDRRTWRVAPEEWEERTKEYAGQMNFVLLTDLSFGEVQEVWFEFESLPLRWVNRTQHEEARLTAPLRDQGQYLYEYGVVLRFLSELSFQTNVPVSPGGLTISRRSYLPGYTRPRRMGGVRYPLPFVLIPPANDSSFRRGALGLYREALDSRSPYYRFLSFYKVIQLRFKERSRPIEKWISENVQHAGRFADPAQWMSRRNLRPSTVAHYLYTSVRCAIAHVQRNPVVNPDNPNDWKRVSTDVPIVQSLAWLLIMQAEDDPGGGVTHR